MRGALRKAGSMQSNGDAVSKKVMSGMIVMMTVDEKGFKASVSATLSILFSVIIFHDYLRGKN